MLSFVMQDIIKRRHFDEIIKNYPFMMLKIIKLPLYVRYNKKNLIMIEIIPHDDVGYNKKYP